ncbi:MAG: hypothetical protein MUC50_13435 [Myxococcota bacterium]|jgi:hypothetical protein|nr:hypothetical protein [Myxococcota bacterium]
MGRHIAKVLCLVTAGFAGWNVLVGLAELYEGWVPPVFGIGTMLVVALVLYFPLGRPLSDMISTQLHNMAPPSRHVRAGTGLDEIPVFRDSRTPAASTSVAAREATGRMVVPKPQPAVPCNLCGNTGGPICPECEAEMKRASKPPRAPHRERPAP